MSNAGRKAKSGERYPSGKLKPVIREIGPAPAQIKRMIDLAEGKAADPTLATSVGWLRLHGKITTLQLSAAVNYAAMRGRFHKIMGFRPRSAASPSYEQGYGITHVHDDQRRIDRIRHDHDGLIKLFRPIDTQFMDRICIDDQMPGSDEMERFVEYLGRVVKHFRMTN